MVGAHERQDFGRVGLLRAGICERGCRSRSVVTCAGPIRRHRIRAVDVAAATQPALIKKDHVEAVEHAFREACDVRIGTGDPTRARTSRCRYVKTFADTVGGAHSKGDLDALCIRRVKVVEWHADLDADKFACRRARLTTECRQLLRHPGLRECWDSRKGHQGGDRQQETVWTDHVRTLALTIKKGTFWARAQNVRHRGR